MELVKAKIVSIMKDTLITRSCAYEKEDAPISVLHAQMILEYYSLLLNIP
jgi:hypothetical protein